MTTSPTLPRHPIRLAANRTGLTPATLRAWEKRYRAVVPARTESGQRLYSDAEVERLRLIQAVREGGRRVSTVAGLCDEELRGLLAEDLEQDKGRAGWGGDPRDLERVREDARVAIAGLDGATLESILRRACMTEGSTGFLTEVLVPVIGGMEAGWVSGRGDPVSEHLVSGVVRRILDWMLSELAPPADGPLLVVGTPAGQSHESGALLAGILAASQGWRVAYLGANLRAERLAPVAAGLGASAIGLSAITTGDEEGVARQVERLRDLMDRRVRIILGGEGASGVAARPASELYRPSALGEFRGLLGG